MCVKLTALFWTFPLNFKIDMPSGMKPSLGCDKANDDFGSAKTRSNSGSIETARPETLPAKLPIRVLGKAASVTRKLLKIMMEIVRIDISDLDDHSTHFKAVKSSLADCFRLSAVA